MDVTLISLKILSCCGWSCDITSEAPACDASMHIGPGCCVTLWGMKSVDGRQVSLSLSHCLSVSFSLSNCFNNINVSKKEKFTFLKIHFRQLKIVFSIKTQNTWRTTRLPRVQSLSASFSLILMIMQIPLVRLSIKIMTFKSCGRIEWEDCSSENEVHTNSVTVSKTAVLLF